MNKDEAEAGIRTLAFDWIREQWQKKQDFDSYLSFETWLSNSEWSGYLNFKSPKAPADHFAEKWFEDELDRFQRMYRGKSPA